MIIKINSSIKNMPKLIDNYIISLNIIPSFIAGYILVFALRIFDTGLIIKANGLSSEFVFFSFLGFLCDLAFYSTLCFITILVLTLFRFIKKHTISAIFNFQIYFVLVCQFIFILYYSKSGILLNEVIFSYPIIELIKIVKASQINFYLITIVLFALLAFQIILSRVKIFKRIKLSFLLVIVTLLLILNLVIWNLNDKISSKTFKNTALSKNQYFYYSLIKSKINKNKGGVKNLDYGQLKMDFSEFKFISSDYPFLHEELKNDVLGSFINKSNESPHIVLIILESFSRAYTGINADIGSFTPFLDSLSNKGLYWENCLSTSERTFGVLPAVLGPLPMGEGGFLSYALNSPEHRTIIDFLNSNGYKTTFSYGGDPSFDNMSTFLTLHNVDIINPSYANNQKQKEKNSNFSWGYCDLDMFKQTFLLLPTDTIPQLNIYLTLSSHQPWVFPEKNKYLIQANKIIDALSPQKQKFAVNHIDELSSICYTDNAVRELFKLYQQRKSFNNTIFIITGDHGVGYFDNPLKTFHVPLIIYSPMLTKNKSFKGVVNHRNITPTLIPYFKKFFAFKSDSIVAWMAQPLDTSITFRSIGFTPIMSINRIIESFIYHNYYRYNDKTYSLNDRLILNEIFDKKITEQIKITSQNYIHFDRFICDNDRLIISKSNSSKNNVTFETENYKGDKNIRFENKSEFPLTLFKIQLDDKVSQYKIDYSFNVKLNENNDQSVHLLMVLRNKKDGNYYYTQLKNFQSNLCFSKSIEFRRSELVKQSRYKYKTGDELIMYIWNASQLSGEINDIRGEICSFTEN